MLVTARASYPNYGPYHLEDAKEIYEYYMGNFENKIIIEKEEPLISIPTDYGKQKEITFYGEEIKKYLPITFLKEDLTFSYEGLELLSVNTKIGTYIETVSLLYQEKMFTSIDLYLNETIEFSFGRYLWFYKERILILMIIFALFSFLLYLVKRKR